MRRVLTVASPASSQALITLAELKQMLGITGNDEDASLNVKIEWASTQIARFCNRSFIAESVVEDVWTEGFTSNVVLSRWPLVSAPTVSEDGVALDAAEFKCNLLTGLLHRRSGERLMPWGEAHLTVSYTAGYSSVSAVPGDVKAACKGLVAMARSKDSRDPLVKSEEIPGVMITGYWVGPVGTDALPPDIQGILKPHRRVNA